MTPKKLSITLAAALLGLATTSYADAASSQLRTFNKGLRAEPPRVPTAPPGPTAPPVKPVQPAQLVVVGGPAAAQDFGTVALGGAPAQPIAIAVRNEGEASGSLGLPTLGGEHPGDFGVTTDCDDVPGGAECHVTVEFLPKEPGRRIAGLTVAGMPFQFSGTAYAVTSYVILKNGTSYTVPAGTATLTAWAVGAGGGGAGSVASDGASGGGGGAGGMAVHSFAVQPGQVITYSLGVGGTGGTGSGNGTAGTATALFHNAFTLTANGGAGGNYNWTAHAVGGTWSGPGTGANGGSGVGSAGDYGGGGGGGLAGGVGNGTSGNGGNGGNGGKANLDAQLRTAIAAVGEVEGAQGGGSWGGNGSTKNVNHGGSATGIGNGGGGAGFYGGNGGNGIWGGGGGGAAGYNAVRTGGFGGNGFILLKLN